jgi:hypothetical protein
MEKLLPLFKRGGARVVFSGHEHNFQHSRANGVDYFVTGAAGKFRNATPDRFEEARTQSWSNLCHFLLARIDGERMVVRAIGGRDDAAGGLGDIQRWTPEGTPVMAPIMVTRRP